MRWLGRLLGSPPSALRRHLHPAAARRLLCTAASSNESFATSPYPPLEPIASSSNIVSLVTQDWPRFGDRLAIADGVTGERRTFAELQARMDAFTQHLVDLGLRRGQRIALVSPNHPDYVVVLLSAVQLGLTISPMNPTLNANEMEVQLQDAEIVMVVASPACPQALEAAGRVPSVREQLVMGPELDAILGSGRAAPVLDSVPADEMAILPYSSGTTGKPKGTMLTHRNIMANVLQMVPAEGVFLGDDDVVLSPGPMFHIYPLVVGLLLNLWRGVPYVTMSGPFSIGKFCAIVAEYRATRCHASPPIVQMLAKSSEVRVEQLASLRMVLCAAAPLYAALEEECAARIGCPVKQAWGMSELSPVGLFTPDDALRGGTLGLVVPSTDVKIAAIDDEGGVDARAAAVPRGEQGELLIRGPQVMRGYLNAPEKTAECMLADGWMRTGDVAVMDADGYLFIRDRLKELIKYKGHQVAPAELEDLLCTHPAVSDAAVIPVEDAMAGELPRAYVVLKPGQQASSDDIVRFVDERVSAFKKLRGGAIIVDSVPKTASGKILRRLVVQQDRARSG